MVKQSDTKSDAAALAAVKHGVASVTERTAASEAARALGRRRAKLAKPGELAALGRQGSTQYWANMSPAERRVEIKRRRAVARRNKKARIGEILK